MASAAKSRLSEPTILALVEARHADPFSVLGPHEVKGGIVIRAFVPGATRLEVIEEETGAVAGRYVAVGKGLKDGDRVVTAGVHSLEEGQKVKIEDEANL